MDDSHILQGCGYFVFWLDKIGSNKYAGLSFSKIGKCNERGMCGGG